METGTARFAARLALLSQDTAGMSELAAAGILLAIVAVIGLIAYPFFNGGAGGQWITGVLNNLTQFTG